MTVHIQEWLRSIALPLIPQGARVAEIGALNVNGSARDILGARCGEWIGWDLVAGPGVDRVGQFHPADDEVFDLIVSCEAFEHDRQFWFTNQIARSAASRSRQAGGPGLYLITVPGLTVPYHSYGGDFYRFTQDAFRQVFFEGFQILSLAAVGPAPHQNICGLAVATA